MNMAVLLITWTVKPQYLKGKTPTLMEVTNFAKGMITSLCKIGHLVHIFKVIELLEGLPYAMIETIVYQYSAHME